MLLPMAAVAAKDAPWLSPSGLLFSPDGRTLHVACATADRVDAFEADPFRRLRSVALPGRPTGMAWSADGRTLHITCSGRESLWCTVDPSTGKLLRQVPVGASATAPVVSANGRTLWICSRFLDRLEEWRIGEGTLVRSLPVPREPIAAALSRDGRHLLVAHHLPDGAANQPPVAAAVSVIETASGKVMRRLQLPNGATGLRDVRVSPDGRYAGVTHLIGRYHVPTTQLDRGWMNNNALTLVDLGKLEILSTVLLDNVDRGAANPWSIAWTPDGRTLCVTHAGTDELSVVDFPGLLRRLRETAAAPQGAVAPADNLALLVGLQRRLPLQGRGPRAVAAAPDGRLYVAGYFSDTIEIVDPATGKLEPAAVLQAAAKTGQVRQGEMLFNDASICFQGWQSCASCHGEEARVDGLNWDLLNDGIGNPKNSKSLLWSHRTPPAMSLSVRDTAEMAVRAGIRGILFSTQPESVPAAMDAWLKSLEPAPSPHLEKGRRSAAAERGRKLFESARVGCTECHPHGLHTDLQSYDVGTAGPMDQPGQLFDTPTLVELWRTAPYLHDGSAPTLQDVFTQHNPKDQHGRTSALKPAELQDLVQYLLSL